MGSGTLSEMTVCQHSANAQILIKALSCKEDAMCEHDPETLSSSLDRSSFKMYRGKVENCFVVRLITFLIIFLNH